MSRNHPDHEQGVSACLLCAATVREFWRDPQNRDVYWECGRCGFVFKDPAVFLDAASERERYSTHQNSPEDQHYLQFLNRLAAPMMPYVASLPGKEGLDYGCGPGPALHTLFEEAGCRMALYDPFFFPDASVLDRMYDFCVCTETAEHFHQPLREFTRLSGLVREGGIIGIMTRMLMPAVDFEDWWYRKDPTHVGFYRPETFRWIASAHQWRIEHITDQVVIAQVMPKAGI